MERTARPWRWLAVAAVLIVAAAVTAVWLHYPAGPGDGPPQTGGEPAVVEQAAGDTRQSQSAPQDPERAKLEELRAMSETFRNTTFLIAIRDAGYRCGELVNVYGGIGDSTTWTVACRELLAYTVRVSSTGTLVVEPILHHIDGVVQADGIQEAPPSPPPR